MWIIEVAFDSLCTNSDIEARNEEYPLTRAVLKLIDTLTDHGLPDGLGTGTRLPGFKPYFKGLQ